MKRSVGLLLLTLTLAGCLGGPRKAPREIVAPLLDAAVAAEWPAADQQLIVVAPSASSLLDSRRVLSRPAPDRLAYLAGVSWPDNAPRLLQDAVIDTLQRSGRLRAVLRPGSGLRGEFVLNLDLVRFEADYSAGRASTGRVEFTATLVQLASGRALGSRRFACAQAADTRDAGAAATAISQALRTCVSELAGWSLAALAGSGGRSD